MENLNQSKCKCGGWGHYVIGIFVILVLLSLASFLVLEARNTVKEHDYIGKSEEVPNTIAVSGKGTITAAADIAKLQVGLTTESATVKEAQEKNTNDMNAVIKALKDLGVNEKDLKTQNYSVNPKYVWTAGKSTIDGYRVYQSLDVKVREIDKVSEILKVTAEKGANQVGNLSFEIDEPEALKEEAREKAIENAKEKAEELADSLDVKLGQVVSFSESGSSPVYPYAKTYALAEGMGGGGGESPSIETGENEVQVNVTIVYEIL